MIAHWRKRTSDSTASTTSNRSSLQPTQISYLSQTAQVSSQPSIGLQSCQQQKTHLPEREESRALSAQHDFPNRETREVSDADGVQIKSQALGSASVSTTVSVPTTTPSAAPPSAQTPATAIANAPSTLSPQALTWKEFTASRPPAPEGNEKHSLLMEWIDINAVKMEGSDVVVYRKKLPVKSKGEEGEN